MISQGLLPKDAIDQHYEQEYQQTFGQDYKVDAEGNVMKQGRGFRRSPLRSSIDAYTKTQTERQKMVVRKKIMKSISSKWRMI